MAENPKRHSRQHAVALRYAEEDRVPRVVATGAGEIARRILEIAEEHNVPIKEDDSLIDILSRLDLGYEIPPDTYRAVAEILAFLYRTDDVWRKRKEEESSEFRRPEPESEPEPEQEPEEEKDK